MESSDYGSGSLSNSPQSWSSLENWSTFKQVMMEEHSTNKLNRTSSAADLVPGKGTLEDVMKEFRQNGSDSPYDPDKVWSRRSDDLVGMGPSSLYLRQKSWPAPERTPVMNLPSRVPDFSTHVPHVPDVPTRILDAPSRILDAPSRILDAPSRILDAPSRILGAPTRILDAPRVSEATSRALNVPTRVRNSSSNPDLQEQWSLSVNAAEFTPGYRGDGIAQGNLAKPELKRDVITQEQMDVLASLSNAVIYSLLRQLEQSRASVGNNENAQTQSLEVTEMECRFCKNNGERVSWYRSHCVRDGSGRVTCPVLRRYVCSRCGAAGDHAHTAKYCPLTTNDERVSRAAMMRSVRQASSRRRPNSAAPSIASTNNYLVYDQTMYNEAPPLDPAWVALEQKLLM